MGAVAALDQFNKPRGHHRDNLPIKFRSWVDLNWFKLEGSGFLEYERGQKSNQNGDQGLYPQRPTIHLLTMGRQYAGPEI